jgi:hypothetical protein
MKRAFISLLIILLILPLVLAINIKVEKTSSQETMIAEIKQPVIFELKITNLGDSDSFEFYNLLGFQMFPIGTTPIESGETEDIELKVSPIGEFDERGSYTFPYYIRGQDNTEIEEKLTFRIVELKDSFEVGSGEVDADIGSIKIFIENKVNFNFEDVNAKISSIFFNLEETFDLGPFEKKEFDVLLDQDDLKKLMAGFYTVDAKINVEDQETEIEGVIRFVEKTLVTTSKKDYGILINTNVITKTNEGNIVEKSETIIKKNIISRLFTSFSPEPDTVNRDGATVYYTWAKEIRPGESFEITVKTNWLFPFLVILLIIAIVIFIKKYSVTDLVLKKKITFVRTKGGEFALKVSILANAKKYVERVNIIDRLPPLVKVHHRFGGEEPTRIDEKTRRVEWNLDKLEVGEVRMISYIIYSKVGIVGRFALPSATALYERNGKIKDTESNKAFFIAEQKKGEVEEI